MAHAADQVVDRLRACATELNDARRLSCYDAAARGSTARDTGLATHFQELGPVVDIGERVSRGRHRDRGVADRAPGSEVRREIIDAAAGAAGRGTGRLQQMIVPIRYTRNVKPRWPKSGQYASRW
jgi:hypothetical protein